MGCKTVTSSKSSRYFFNEIEDTSLPIASMGNQDQSNMASKVKLTVSIKNVKNNSEYKVQLITYADSAKKSSKIAGTTEPLSKNEEGIILFNQFFSMLYYFEKQQPLDLVVSIGSSSTKIETTLGNIMGSRRQTFIKNLESGENLEVQASEMSSSSNQVQFSILVRGQLKGMEVNYLIKHMGTMTNPANSLLYKSEDKKDYANTINFSQCCIPINYLAPSGNNSENLVNIDFNDIKHKKVLGNYNGDLGKLIDDVDTQVNLAGNNIARINTKIVNKPSFISYLRSGMQINLTIGIDFTGSNGHPKDYGSLHYVSDKMNDYESAIRSCGDILAYYDADQLFPVFGFGFRYDNAKFTNRYTYMNYPINDNVNDPNINTIDNVLLTYRNFIDKIHLSGPTNFAPLINDLNKVMEDDIAQGETWNYNILMILTDGQIDDMQATKNALVKASFLPCSVIIIGIGNGNFTNMDILDADENPLYDSSGRKADRDLVQFVPFNKFKGNAERLAAEVLEEVPRQVVEYYQHQHMDPKI